MRTGLISAGCHPFIFKMTGGYECHSSAVAQTPPDGITVLAVVGRFNGHKAAEADTSYIRFFRHVSFNSLSFPGFCYASLINSQCSLYVAQYLCPTISVRKILFDEPHAIASRFSPNPSAQNADSPFTSRYGHSQNGWAIMYFFLEQPATLTVNLLYYFAFKSLFLLYKTKGQKTSWPTSSQLLAF